MRGGELCTIACEMGYEDWCDGSELGIGKERVTEVGMRVHAQS